MSYGDSNCQCTDDSWCGCLDNPTLDEILAVEYQRQQAREPHAVTAEASSTQPAPSVPMEIQWLAFIVGALAGGLSLFLPIPPGYSIFIGGVAMILTLPALMLWHECRSNRPVNVPIPESDTGVKIGVSRDEKHSTVIVEVEPTDTAVTLVNSTAEVIPFPKREEKAGDENKQEVA